MEQHYTVAEVADKLRFSRRWVLRAIETGKLRALKLCSPDAGRVSDKSRISQGYTAYRILRVQPPVERRVSIDWSKVRKSVDRLGDTELSDAWGDIVKAVERHARIVEEPKR